MGEELDNLILDQQMVPLSGERELWEDLERADFPVRALLKRANRILDNRFPEANMVTCSSCSGHIQEGHENEVNPQMLLTDKPHLWIAAPDASSTEEQRDRMSGIFKDVFTRALIKVNDLFGEDALTLSEFLTKEPCSFGISGKWYENEYIYRLTIDYGKKKDFETVQSFWNKVEEALGQYDKLSVCTQTQVEDFKKQH